MELNTTNDMFDVSSVARSAGFALFMRGGSWGSAALHPRLYAVTRSAGSEVFRELKDFSWQRSEERRVGKECRSRWWRCQLKRNRQHGFGMEIVIYLADHES